MRVHVEAARSGEHRKSPRQRVDAHWTNPTSARLSETGLNAENAEIAEFHRRFDVVARRRQGMALLTANALLRKAVYYPLQSVPRQITRMEIEKQAYRTLCEPQIREQLH